MLRKKGSTGMDIDHVGGQITWSHLQLPVYIRYDRMYDYQSEANLPGTMYQHGIRSAFLRKEWKLIQIVSQCARQHLVKEIHASCMRTPAVTNIVHTYIRQLPFTGHDAMIFEAEISHDPCAPACESAGKDKIFNDAVSRAGQPTGQD